MSQDEEPCCWRCCAAELGGVLMVGLAIVAVLMLWLGLPGWSGAIPFVLSPAVFLIGMVVEFRNRKALKALRMPAKATLVSRRR